MPRKPTHQSKKTDALIQKHAVQFALDHPSDAPNAALFPYNGRWEEPQRMHVFVALIQCNNDAAKALEILKERAQTDETVRVPTVNQILTMRKMHMQEYMETIYDMKSLTRLMKLIDSKREEIGLAALKYQADRTHGQPAKKIEMDVTVSLSALEAKARERGEIPDLPYLPPGKWSDTDPETGETP